MAPSTPLMLIVASMAFRSVAGSFDTPNLPRSPDNGLFMSSVTRSLAHRSSLGVGSSTKSENR
jgi:hypothetical protein